MIYVSINKLSTFQVSAYEKQQFIYGHIVDLVSGINLMKTEFLSFEMVLTKIIKNVVTFAENKAFQIKCY